MYFFEKNQKPHKTDFRLNLRTISNHKKDQMGQKND